jgi:hypothetical protein
VTFNGSATQYIGGTSRTSFHNLTLESNTELLYTASVGGELTLNGVSLKLNNNNLIFGGATSITGASNSNYIITNGSGRLEQWVSTSNVYYPVGTMNSFLPIRLKNNGTYDKYSVRVFEDVLIYGTVGTTIPEIDNCVNASWSVSETVIGGSDLTITTYWVNSNEGTAFDRTKAGIGHFTAGNWEPQPAQSASPSLPHSITKSGITAPSTFAVGDINSPMAITLDIVVDLTVLLEGPFNGTDMNTMNSTILPASQPYNVSPWNYPGTENVTEIPNTGVVDWIFVELRDAGDPTLATQSTTIARQAGFILSDGRIVGTDGISNMQFDVTFSQNLYVAVFHRNHLGIISSYELILSGGLYSYDFTTGSYLARGDNEPQKELTTGVFGMYAGDINSNGSIGFADKNLWSSDAGKSNYLNTDTNLDGEVDNRDKNETIIPNNGEVSYIPN